MSQRVDFIDVSRYQGGIDFRAVAGDGILAVIAKATEGSTYVDPQFAVNRAGALGAGLAFAAYHFLLHGNVEAQMSHFLAITDPPPGARLVIDYEDVSVGIEDLVEAVDALAYLRPDAQLTVYGASKLADDATGYALELGQTSLWAARYSDNPPVIAEDVWSYWSAWQFTDSGQVAGIQGAVDLNTFNGSRDACLEWFGGAPLPQPEPEPIMPPLVVIDIVVPDGVSVEVSVNSVILSHAGVS